jgi:rhodanese-related sulfurtransferase
MSEIRLVTAEQLRERLDRGSVVELWNALTDDYFTGEMIPGSRRVPVDQVGREVAQTKLPRHAEIVVYCSGPACPQSRAAAEKLTQLGYEGVWLFEGGLEAWKAAGLPLEAEAVAG